MRKFVLFFLAVLASGTLLAQNRQVSGTVSAQDGTPVAGATVIVKETSVGTATDAQGHYSIMAPAGATLAFSSLGLIPVEVAIGGRTTVNAVMQPDAEVIGDVLVVAYGTASRKSFTGSASTITAGEISKRKVSNVTKALDGLAPGIQTTSGAGQPGSGVSVRVRGFGSINASQDPLYVVDGMPYGGQINAINPDDIETISVLKDASASALYGARGANGVVIITTKRGQRKGVDVDLKINIGLSSRAFPYYETMGQKDWVETMYSAFYNTAISRGVPQHLAGAEALQDMASGPERIFGDNEMYNPYNVPVANLIDTATGKLNPEAKSRWDESWLKEVTKKAALRQNYIASISGGVEKVQYMFSLGYLDEKGVLETTRFRRYSARANIDAQPKEWLNAGLSVNFSQNTSNYSRYANDPTGETVFSNVFYTGQIMAPIYPVYLRDKDGNFDLDKVTGNKQFDYGKSRPTTANYNAIASLYEDVTSNQNENLSARTHVDLLAPKVFGNWAQGIKFSVNFGADYYNNRQSRYNNPNKGDGEPVKGRLRKYNPYQLEYTLNQLLTYGRTFGKHSVDVLLGHEYSDHKEGYVLAERTGFPFSGITELGPGSTMSQADSNTDIYRLEGFLSRLNYSYDDRYYISANLRRDRSSRFHPNHQWGAFWGVGATWRLSKEKFLRDVKWIDNLSVKASYGVQGNDGILDSDGYDVYYAWQGLYALDWINNKRPGGRISTMGNDVVSWESNKNVNIGLEAELFGRLTVTLEWYNRLTTGLLLKYPKAGSTGFQSYNRNSGTMRNRGIEFSVKGVLMKNKDFYWDLTVMGSTVRNKVLSLTDEGQPIINGNRIIKVGETLNSYFLPESAGVDPASGDQLYWVYKTDPVTKELTDERVITNNRSEAVTEGNRKIFGSRNPAIYGSINTSFRWKSIDFSLATYYSIGGKILDRIYNGFRDFMYTAEAKHVDLKRAWKKPGDITDIPRNEVGATRTTTNDNLINASYFSIKNITLGYTFPESLLGKAGIKQVRLSASVDNLVMWSHLKGMDPQYNFSGSTAYVYSANRTVSFNLDFKF